jgi:hypothetical protein
MVERGPGISLMTIGMLVAGIGCLLAGLLAIGFGIPINEFGLGNTLILAGSVAACSGLIILSLWVAVRELKSMARQFGSSPALESKHSALQPVALPSPGEDESGIASLADVMGGEHPGAPPHLPPSASPSAPWVDEPTARDRSRQEAAPENPARQRRNLMFSSTSRRERERAQARAGEPIASEPRAASAASEASEFPPANFDDAWPKSERVRPAEAPSQRRPLRNPSTSGEPAATRQPPAADQQPVTVLKSGVVEGMAYSLYSDGSIEAQMPEGMMRFASIDELRAHLDQRP